MSDDKTPARVLPFAQKPRPRPKPPTRQDFARSFLDPPGGLTIDVTVRKPTEPDKG